MKEPLYLAYGSNLHPLRLQARVPSARPVRTVPVPGERLRFNKRSGVDDSAKATLDRHPEAVAWGVLFEMDLDERPHLDAAESLGAGYDIEFRLLEIDGQGLEVFTYRAQPEYLDDTAVPFQWYRDLVLEGARHHGFPEAYIRRIASLGTQHDPDVTRAHRHATLLEQIRQTAGPA